MSNFTIHFSHANGFPASTYRKFFHYLSAHFELGYLELLGHNPHYPVDDNWQSLVAELIATVEKRYKKPVIGVGHSLGGALTYMAALQRPDLFQAIVLLDSPILGSFKSKVLGLAKQLGFVDRLTPARRTKNRRATFHHLESAYEYFKSKELFKNFDPDCLRAYVEEGLVQNETGWALKFSPRIEYQIYRTIPHHLPGLKQKLLVPAALIYGEHTDVMDRHDIKLIRDYYGFTVVSTPGGHLFPFEHPAQSARCLTKVILDLKEW